MIWDRLGVITDEVAPQLIEALDWIQKQGLKHVEIRRVDGINILDSTEEQVIRIRKEVEKRGMFVSALASPLFKCLLDSTRPVTKQHLPGASGKDAESHHRMLQKAIHYAKLLGTPYIRIFSFWREEKPQQHTAEIVEHLKRAAAEAEQAGIILLLENEHDCNGGYAREVADLVVPSLLLRLRCCGTPKMRSDIAAPIRTAIAT